MNKTRRNFLIGALAALVLPLAAYAAVQSQVIWAPGQPVTITGATAAAPGATATSGLKINTINTITNGYLLDVQNNGTSEAHLDYAGIWTSNGAATTVTDAAATNSAIQKFVHTTTPLVNGGSILSVSSTSVGDNATLNGTLLDLSAVSATSTLVMLTDNSLTSGIGISVPHTTSPIAGAGTLLSLTSTSADTGTSNLLTLSSSGAATSTLMTIGASFATQTTETALAVTQSGVTTGYTGTFVNLTGSSTTGAGTLLGLTCVNTTAGSCQSVTNSALTSGTEVLLTGSGSAELTGGKLLDVEMGAATVGAGVKVLTSGTYTDAAAAPLWVVASSTTTGTDVLVSTGPSLTNAGSAIRVNDSTSDTFRVGVDGHLSGYQTTAPVVTSSGGSAATCTNANNDSAKCTDTHGVMGYTTAVGTAAITLTFHTAYAKPPVCVISPADALTATDFYSTTTKVAVQATASALVLTPAGNWAATAKRFNYICME